MPYQRDVFAVDSETGALLTIDTIHHEVHEGEMFSSEYNNTSVSNGASLDMRLTTGTKRVHLVFETLVTGLCLAYLYEGATISGGTALAEYNMDRNSANAALMAVTHTPTVTATGSTAIINGRIIPGGTSPTTRVGSGVRSSVERILKVSTEYLLRITNSSGGTIPIGVVLEWYEE
jgi:hypothetical protein